MSSEMEAGIIFESAKVATDIARVIEDATLQTMSQYQSQTLSASCDGLAGAWANSLYQWVTKSTDDKISVGTGIMQCRYNENVGIAPHCPAFACDYDATHFQCENCIADWKA